VPVPFFCDLFCKNRCLSPFFTVPFYCSAATAASYSSQVAPTQIPKALQGKVHLVRSIKVGKAKSRQLALQCAEDGSVDLRKVEQAIRINTRVIVITHASNVTGTVMPVREIGAPVPAPFLRRVHKA